MQSTKFNFSLDVIFVPSCIITTLPNLSPISSLSLSLSLSQFLSLSLSFSLSLRHTHTLSLTLSSSPPLFPSSSSRHSSASGIHQLQHQKQDSRGASALARLRSSGHPSPVDDLLRDDDDAAGEGDQMATAMTTSLEAPPPTVAELPGNMPDFVCD